MVTIRLSRGGTNKRPFYHIVVTDSRSSRDGRYIERIGYYNPIAAGKEVPLLIENERIEYWMSKGALPSDRVAKLIKDFAKGVNPTETKSAKKSKKPQAETAAGEEAVL